MSELGRPRGEDLLSLAAHQLKTPLAVIAGHAELMQARASDNGIREEAAYIADAAGKLGAAIDGLLALFALDTARVSEPPHSMSLQELVNRAVAAFSTLRGAQPKLPEGGLPQVVRGDPTRLSQALGTLLSCGYSMLPDGDDLKLGVEERRGVVMFSINCATGWTLGDGARFSLYVAARLVEADGASVFVREQGGKVSSVVMMLPTPEQEHASAGRSRVLIVDDDDTMRRLLRATLPEAEGFEIVEASDGREALVMLEQDDPVDLVLLDWMMPGRSGADVLEELRSRHPEIPVIVVTAELEPRQRELAESLGADVFLTKPFSPLQLLEHVERILPRRVADPARNDL
jgi:CheY-like chemotaxis protein